jgi:hypothetical protein
MKSQIKKFQKIGENEKNESFLEIIFGEFKKEKTSQI